VLVTKRHNMLSTPEWSANVGSGAVTVKASCAALRRISIVDEVALFGLADARLFGPQFVF